LAESISSFAALFRAVLLIHGFEPPVGKREIVAAMVRELKLDGAAFEKIFEIRENNTSKLHDEISANQLFADYMSEIERVIEAVDKVE
jgi:hypothetical protein